MNQCKVIILGATGSIGRSTLDVIRRNQDKFTVVGISAHTRTDELLSLAREFKLRDLAVSNEQAALKLKAQVGNDFQIHVKHESLLEAVQHDAVVSAIVGFAGIQAAFTALKTSKFLLIANKESIVCGGNVLKTAQLNTNCQIVPLDSEHQSLYQLLKQVDRASVSKVTITGSGGPFLHTPVMNLAEVTPEQAIAHPRWKMGPKISTDSATMFNKALELVEAHYLFDLPAEKIAVLIHPQSVVHGLVDLDSGESHAALAPADMRVPITNALTELVKEDTNHGTAQRKASQLVSGVTACELTKVGKLEFFAPDFERFPALKLGYEVIKQGEGYPIVLNAANEIAVASFLGQQLKFTQIAKIVEETLARYHGRKILTLEDIYEVDAWARSQASNLTVTH